MYSDFFSRYSNNAYRIRIKKATVLQLYNEPKRKNVLQFAYANMRLITLGE
jgi:hypothetical protein